MVGALCGGRIVRRMRRSSAGERAPAAMAPTDPHSGGSAPSRVCTAAGFDTDLLDFNSIVACLGWWDVARIDAEAVYAVTRGALGSDTPLDQWYLRQPDGGVLWRVSTCLRAMRVAAVFVARCRHTHGPAPGAGSCLRWG